MKAVRIRRPGGPEVLEIGEMPDPTPRAGEALVRIRAAGVNRADLLQRMGRYPAPAGAPAEVPGLEFAGEVVRVEGGGGPAAGARVMGLLGGGGYAELVAVPVPLLLPVPRRLSWPEAAAVPEAFLTAADALFARGRLLPAERVLIHAAAGGVGTAALQLARAAGAELVVGTASESKLRGLRDRGLPLDVAVDYRSESFREAVERATDGEGVDVILDTVGAPYWRDNVASLSPLGRWVLVGLLGGARVEVDLAALMRNRLTVVGTVLRSRSVAEKAALTEEFGRRFLPLLEDGTLRPVLDRTFRLEEAAEAHRYMAANRNLGRLVLEI